MNPRFCIAFALLGIGSKSLDAQLDVTVKAYHEWKAAEAKCKSEPACSARSDIEKSASTTYLKGIGDGFVWSNVSLNGMHRDRLYCQPEKLGMDAANYDQILESFLPKANQAWNALKSKEWKSVEDVPVGFVLLMALIDAFPCGAEVKQP